MSQNPQHPTFNEITEKIKHDAISQHLTAIATMEKPYMMIFQKLAEENKDLKEEIALLKSNPKKSKNRAERRQEQRKIEKSKK